MAFLLPASKHPFIYVVLWWGFGIITMCRIPLSRHRRQRSLINQTISYE